ncbi:MAG: DNA-binding response regulator [Stutzerimonas stutzeri]|nr:MAG: DNA-binding response regulator [Stutzerimonas stutzeri]
MAEEAVVHIVDNDAAVRQSLSFLLASDGLPVRLHESAVAFLDKVGAGGRGCVVTDVRMPEIDGIEFLRRLRQSGYAMPVIVMTGHADVPLAVEAMKEGALDFVEKPFDDETILGAVRSALSRHRERFRIDNETQEIRQRLQSLSERERQVLDGLVAGKANKVIAFDLDISPRTVEIYRANVMTKMQARSLSELVRFVLLAGAKEDKP